MKYSPSWTRSASQLYTGSLTTQLFDIRADSNGNVYAVGTEEVLENQRSWHNALLLKFSADGTLLWSRRHRNTTEFMEAQGKRVAVDPAGNVYLGGWEQRSGIETIQTPSFRAWLGKYSPDGVLLWQKTVDNVTPPELTSDSGGNLLAAYALARAGQGDNIVLTKYDVSGNLLWTTEYNDDFNGDDHANGVVADGAGNVYIAGSEYRNLPLDGGLKALLLKYSQDGTLQFQRVVGSGNNGNPGGTTFDVGNGVAVGGNGDTYVAASIHWRDPTGQLVWALHYGPDGTLKNYFPPTSIGPISGTALGVSSISWTWSDTAQNSKGYKAISWTAVLDSGVLAANATTWALTGLTPNAPHQAYVYAFNDDGIISAGPAQTCTLASMPGVPAVTGRQAFGATLAWSPGSNPMQTNYEVFASTLAIPPVFPSAQITASTSGIVKGLLPSTTYYFSVRALNCDGVPTGLSASVSTVTLPLPGQISASPISPFGGAFVGIDTRTIVSLDPGIPPDANIFISKNPFVTPIEVSTADIAGANAALPSTSKSISSSIREIVLHSGDADYGGKISGRLTLPYDDVDGDGFVDGISPPVKPDQLSVYTLSGQKWEAVPGALVVDYASHTVSVPITHLSVYTLLAITAAPDCGGARVYPIPWKPGSADRFDSANVAGCGRGLIFDKMTTNATVRIYNIVGDLVRELPVSASDGGCKAWDGKNDGGADVASGIYVAVLKCDAGSKHVKFAIER